jgi:hypothetical protein
MTRAVAIVCLHVEGTGAGRILPLQLNIASFLRDRSEVQQGKYTQGH